MARVKSPRYQTLRAESLAHNGERLAYAFSYVEDPKCEIDRDILLNEVALWLRWVDFALDFVDPRDPFGGHPNGSMKAQRAWQQIAWALQLVCRQLAGLRDRTPDKSPIWHDIDRLLLDASLYRLDIVEQSLDNLLVPIHDERIYPEPEFETIH